MDALETAATIAEFVYRAEKQSESTTSNSSGVNAHPDGQDRIVPS